MRLKQINAVIEDDILPVLPAIMAHMKKNNLQMKAFVNDALRDYLRRHIDEITDDCRSEVEAINAAYAELKRLHTAQQKS